LLKQPDKQKLFSKSDRAGATPSCGWVGGFVTAELRNCIDAAGTIGSTAESGGQGCE